MNSVISKKIKDVALKDRSLDIYVGDVTSTEELSPVDILCISAFPNDYWAEEGTVIHSLSQKGINVEQESDHKLFDWREQWQCWASTLLVNDVNIRQLICFEHAQYTSKPDEVVGNVFRSIRELILSQNYGDALPTVRLPLLSTGDQGHPKPKMLEAMIRQAYLHLQAGLPVQKIEFVIYPGMREVYQLCALSGQVLDSCEKDWLRVMQINHDSPQWDLFFSYRHTNIKSMQGLIHDLKSCCADTSYFIDDKDLVEGYCWKPQLINNMARSRYIVCWITDDYADSGECMDEFHAAQILSFEGNMRLLPILNLKSRSIESLPDSLRRIHMIDPTELLQSGSNIAKHICSLTAS